LYGGVIDADHQRRVQTLAGGVTAHVRRELGLSRFLGSDVKTREDHRHHAVDAIAVALTGTAMVQRLSLAAEAAAALNRRRFAPLDNPWPTFQSDAQHAIDAIIPSFRVELGLRGALHNDSYYSLQRAPDGGTRVVKRVRLDQLSAKDVEQIVDPIAREVVRAALAQRGQTDPSIAFAEPDNHPVHPRASRPIHKVRVKESVKTLAVGHGSGVRHVKPGENHHLPIYGVPDASGVITRWQTGKVISRFEAACRDATAAVPIDHGASAPRLLFDLHKGDILEIDGPSGGRELVRVLQISDGDVQLWPLRAVPRPA